MPLVLQISFYAITMQIGRKPVQKEVLFKMVFFRHLLAVVRWSKQHVFLLERDVSCARQLYT